jgi:hypothetical protein
MPAAVRFFSTQADEIGTVADAPEHPRRRQL